MDVRCPVLPEAPWSPVGYRVVEITEEQAPWSPPDDHEEETDHLMALAAEELGWDLSPPSPAASKVPECSPRRGRRQWVLGAVAAGGSCLVVVALLLVLVRLPALARGGMMPVALAAVAGQPGAVVCHEDSRPEARENFGTAVGFVRNPREAARAAASERKLLFLLHVSGSFEDSGFT
jgi:hypothetical protein